MDELFRHDSEEDVTAVEKYDTYTTDIADDTVEPHEEPAVPAEPYEESAAPAEPYEEPVVPAESYEESATPAEPYEEPAVPAEPYEEPAAPADPHEDRSEESDTALLSDEYSYSSSADGQIPGEYADERYDEPYYDDADYDDAYYDDEYYEDDDYEDYAEDAGQDAYADSLSEQRHSYDPNGAEDEKPVYGSYYASNNVQEGKDEQAEPADEAKARGPYTSKYDAYRFVTPEGDRAGEARPVSNEKRRERSEKEPEQKPRKKSRGLLGRILTAALLAVVFGSVASAVFLGVLKVSGFKMAEKHEEAEIAQAVPTEIPALGSDESSVIAGEAATDEQNVELTVPQVVELCMPSMVSITNTSVSQYYDFFGGSSSRENVSAGSGIIVATTDTEMLIATNNHVITNSSEITVTFIDEEAVAGTVKGTDADNDLAIVAVKLDDIKEETKKAIRVITIGDSNNLKVGESVVAIGNALGYGQSVSRGVISALNRNVNVDGMSHQLIQTDASINPGNSGGALLNMRGELIGINEIKYVNTDVEGVGYAIPTATAQPILQSLGSKVARTIVDDENASYIGVLCMDVLAMYVQSGYPAGVFISEVTKGGPAEKAGIKEGDIITAMDGISIASSSQLITYLKYYAAGEEVDFSVSRLNEDETAYEKIKIKITLGNRKDSGIDESKEEKNESLPESGSESSAENGGFDVIPDEKR